MPSGDPTTNDGGRIDALTLRSTADDGFGVTDVGFVPKSFARVLAEKLALARELFGSDVDLGSGSAIRKLLEISALEDARTWSALGAAYDDAFVATATGDALGRLGAELGFERPYLEAYGAVTLTLTGTLPPGRSAIAIARGARMLTDGGHHAATDQPVTLTAAAPQQDVRVVAFYPGPEHNLDPGTPDQKLVRWNLDDAALGDLVAAQEAATDAGGAVDVTIDHSLRLTGGERGWPDDRYRVLLLRAPRSIWTVDAIRIAASLVPGVRQVQVRDAWGGLDIHQSVFGTSETDFLARLFSADQEAASPYRVLVVVAPTAAAIWEGPTGLRASVRAAIEDLRPVSIFPRVQEADQIGVGVSGDVAVRGLALPSGSRATVNASPPAIALKDRLAERVRVYVDDLGFGEPVRFAEVISALMGEPGVVDVRNLRLLKYPPGFEQGGPAAEPVELVSGANVELQVNQVPVFVADRQRLRL